MVHEDRSAVAEAVFSSARGRMGRRSRFRKAGPREPNGKPSRANRPIDLNPAYSANHRLEATDQVAAAAHLRSLSLIAAHMSGRMAGHPQTRDERKDLRGSTEIVLATTRATNSHHKRNLAFPAGLAFELGLFRQLR